MNLGYRVSGKLFWIASYPKSGNTWTRAFIANLLNEDTDPVDINQLNTGAIASSRSWVETGLEFDIDELSHDEVDALRPNAYRWHSQNAAAFEYHKTHDAYSLNNRGEALFPAEATAGVLLIIRNPLDVAVSFAHHLDVGFEKAIDNMCDPAFAFCKKGDKIHDQLRQIMFDWSTFYRSWLNSPLPTLVVRYEDMRQRPLETFVRIAEYLHLPFTEHEVQLALDNCALERLQEQEQAKTFRERSSKAERFFRKGMVGEGATTLSVSQVEMLCTHHQELMRQFAYLD